MLMKRDSVTFECITYLLVLGGMFGCFNGTVVVGSPQIFTRERLVQERVEEESWLKSQLEKTPTELSFQGLRDVRDFSALSQELRATVDPMQGQLLRLDHNIEKAKKELDLAKAEQQLKAYRESLEATPENSEQAGTSNSSTSTAASALQIPSSPTQKVSPPAGGLPSGTTAQRTTAQPGTLDLLHDQLSFRNAVRAAMRERQLDDAHDLTGSMIYDFQFDVTVKPSTADDKYAQIRLRLENPYCGNKNEDDRTYFRQLYQTWAQAHEKLLNGRVFEMQDAYLKGNLQDSDRQWLVQRIAVDLPKLQDLFIQIGRTIPPIDDIIKEEQISRTMPPTDDPREKEEITKFRADADPSFPPKIRPETSGYSYSMKAWEQYERQLKKLRPKDRSEFKSAISNINEKTLGQLEKAAVGPQNTALQQAIPLFLQMGLPLPIVLFTIKDMAPNLVDILQQFQGEKVSAMLTERNIETKAAVLLAIAWGVFSDEQWLNASPDMQKIIILVPPMTSHRQLVESLSQKGSRNYGLPRITLLDSTGTGPLDSGSNGSEELEKILCKDNEQVLFVTKSVEPKEYAQNISDVAAYEQLLTQVASVKALFPTAGATAESNLERVRKRQEYLQAILRKPLAIGFGEGKQYFGWILGPRFIVDSSTSLLGWLGNLFYQPSPVTFTHEPVRHSVRASVQVPVWLNDVLICYESTWAIDKPSDSPSFCSQSGPKGHFRIQLPARKDRWETLSRFLNPNSRYTHPTMVITYPYRNPNLNPSQDQLAAPIIMLPKKDDLPTHKQTLLILGENLWRNPEVYLDHVRASTVAVLSDMAGLYATFDFTNGAKEVVTSLGTNSRDLDLTVVTSLGTVAVPRAVQLHVPPSRPAGWPSAKIETPRLMANIPQSSLAFTLNSPLSPKGYASLHLYARNESPVPGPWRLLATPVSLSQDGKKIQVCEGSKSLSGDDCSFPDLSGGAPEAAELTVKLAAKLNQGDPDTSEISIEGQRSMVFFKTSDHAKAILSAPSSRTITIQRQSAASAARATYGATSPISVSLPVYNSKPDLFLSAYPDLKRAIGQNQVELVLSHNGHMVHFPTTYYQGSVGNAHQFVVSEDTLGQKGSFISASPSGDQFDAWLQYEGGKVEIKEKLTIRKP